ncbi:MAG TPA: radical SAM protein [Terrimicrobiaceae bacterium]
MSALPKSPQPVLDLTSPEIPVGTWTHPAVISANNFFHKSLSEWAFNIAVGCSHGCRFCYVPSVTTIKQAGRLRPLGVDDPDADWGQYVFLRRWDEKKFISSLAAAEALPKTGLKADGNRAVIYCSTTDPYQVYFHPDPEVRTKLTEQAKLIVRRSLELIRDHSTINVRILTRSPLARRDFDLYESFGKRLLFGMSLPTTRDDLAKIYEPRAPAPSKRLETLKSAKGVGLHVYVAMAPTYPESDEDDLLKTLDVIGELDPVTIFHEPINIRSENIERIAEQARRMRVRLKTEVFATQSSWAAYAREALQTVETLAKKKKLTKKLHLWPDKGLGSKAALQTVNDPDEFVSWLNKQWSKVSAWPR